MADLTTYVVRRRLYIGAPIGRWAEDHEVIEGGDEDAVARAVLGMDGPDRVVAFNVAEGWSRDISEDVARKVAHLIRYEDWELTRSRIAFVEEHCGVGTVLPAVA